ncbi:MAG: hypothetical protein KDA98_04855 [Acidimicrobiales bacterium]|nr:hypothetical protein [Acidimicrobiales bacterium]
MTTTERQRLDLHHRLDEALGPDHAATLMDSLSPIPWTELATKEDLADLRAELDLRFDRVDLRFEQIDLRFDQIDARFDQIDARFERIDARFDQVDGRLTLIDGRFEVEMALLRGELAEFRATLSADLMRQLVVIHAATVALIVGLLYGGSALLG